MAIEKFRFVSPGVQFNEIDESVLPPVPPPIGPVVIGTAAKGPFMQPVVINNVAELEKIFGMPSNGNVGSIDVWRTNTPTAPTFGTYAAKAYLRNAAPVTFVRLGGVASGGNASAAPGWEVGTAYHIFTLSGTEAKLASVIYVNTTGTVVQLSNSAAGFVSAGSASVTDNSFSLYFSGSTGRSEAVVSLNPSNSNFIRKVLNTNPTRIVTENYFLGETFEDSCHTESFTVFVSASSGWASRTTALSSPETGWIVGDHTSGADPTNLFKFKGLNSGNSLSGEIKVSIENVRASTNERVTKYGTFDVVVRKLFEKVGEAPLERFNAVNLDAASDNYILKRIGDSVRSWDANNSRYVEEGLYSNKSAYIRVEMSSEEISPYDLPHGFRMPGRPKVGTNGSFTYSGTTYTATHPNPQLLTSAVTVGSAKKTRFGLRTAETVVGTTTATRDIIDIVREKPSITAQADVTFSSRFINGTDLLTYVSGTYNSTADLLTAGRVLGFDIPMYGGSDGANILKAEPFVNQSLLTGKSVTNSAAYRSISQAIDIVSNPEIIDMNILCIPNLKEESLTQKMIDVCRERGDAMAIIDLEGDHLFPFEGATSGKTEGDKPVSVTSVINNLNDRQIDDSYGAAYFPAVFVPSENIFMPASIAAFGAFGGTEGRSALWFAPAGFNRGGLTLANAGIGVTKASLTLSATDRDLLYEANINPIATFPNEGVVIFGQKTLQKTPSALDRVNVRRLVNFIKKEISRVATRILFEPNVEATWSSFKGVVDPFLLAIKNGFGLDDARVVLDETTTTADLVDRNIMYAKIFIKPTRAIEYIAIDFVITNSGAAFTE